LLVEREEEEADDDDDEEGRRARVGGCVKASVDVEEVGEDVVVVVVDGDDDI